MTKKEKKDEEHVLGKRTRNGYNIRDGMFYIAPVMVSRIENVIAQGAGLKRFMQETNTFLANRHTELEKESALFWGDVFADLDLEVEGHRWTYNPQKKCIFDAPEPKPEPERQT